MTIKFQFMGKRDKKSKQFKKKVNFSRRFYKNKKNKVLIYQKLKQSLHFLNEIIYKNKE